MTLHRVLRVVCLVLVLSTITPVGEALACTCALRSPCAAFADADTAIFVGTVLEVSSPVDTPGRPPTDRVARVRFAVNEAFRDASGSTIVVSTDLASGCGYTFQAGESYLVFASRTASGLSTDACSRTAHLSAARDDLEILQEAQRGVVRSRLKGTALLLMARMNGTLIPAILGGLPDIKVVARTGPATHETTTDVTGAFRFFGLEPGRYTVRADSEPVFHPMFDREVTVQLDACSAEADLFLTVPSFAGKVRRPDGTAGPPGLRVTVVEAGHVSASEAAITFTDAEGRWTLDGLQDGRYLVGINVLEPPRARSPFPPLWYPGVSQARQGQELGLRDQRPRQVDFTLPAPLPLRTIGGIVLDADGQTIRQATVLLIDAEYPNQDVDRATTDEGGRFTLSGVVGRQLSVRARLFARDGSFVSDAVTIAGDAGDGAVTLTLSRTLEPSPRPSRP